MIPEERDEWAYQSLSWKIRFLIRIIVYLMNILNSVLKPYSMSPVFAIYDTAEFLDEIEVDWDGPDDDEDDEDILQ